MEKSRGIVAIYGWMMCKPKHLDKIAAWWTQRRFTPVTVEGKPEVLFSPMGSGRPTGARLAKELEMLDKTTHTDGSKPPIFFHVFSGQGGATLAHTMHQMSPSQKSRVGGIVMDCVAATMDIDQATLGFKSAFHANPWLGEVLGPPFWLAGQGLALINPNINQWRDEYQELMMASCPRWQVFHSKADPYVPHERLTELVEKKRAAGGDVNYKLWETGGHVALFRDHKEEYSDMLEKFVQKAEEEYYKDVPVPAEAEATESPGVVEVTAPA